MNFEEDFIAHYGKMGMKWGKKRADKQNEKVSNLNSAIKINPKTGKFNRFEAKRLTRANRKANTLNYKQAVRENPSNFKRDVKETRKGKGIRLAPGSDIKYKGQTKLDLTYFNSTKGFTDSRKKKVGEDYAHAVLRKATQKNDRARLAKIGAFYAAPILATVAYSAIKKRGF